MPKGLKQVSFLLVIGVLFQSTVAHGARPSGPYGKQLADECDALIQAAVRRPYGWGWDTVALTSARSSAASRHIAMEPPGTPAAGLLLLWSGQLLEEPKYRQAALEAARGVGAAQMPSGQVPLHAVFAGAAGGRDEASQIPDRTATRAGLVLMLAVLETDDPKPETLSRSAQRAVQWMMRQQTDDGGWPSGYMLKREQPLSPESLRIIRLDSVDSRDSTFAMLLASQTMDDRQVSRSATRAVQKIGNLRLGAAASAPTTQEDKADLPTTQPREPGIVASLFSDDAEADRRTNNLWSTVYRLNGMIDLRISEFPAAADITASKYAMQTLLGGYLMSGDRQTGIALDSALGAINQLRDADGKWKRKYLRLPSTNPSTQESEGIFGPRPVRGPTDFDLPPTLAAVQQLKLIGRDRYLALLTGHFTLKQHLAATVCGLTDRPMTLQLPVTKVEAETYLREHAGDFSVLNSPIPDNLSDRLNRLWALLIRAKLELKMQSPG